MITFLDYRTTLSYLAYMGYPGFKDLIKVQEKKRAQGNRTVFLAYVFGSKGVGKVCSSKKCVKFLLKSEKKNISFFEEYFPQWFSWKTK